MPVVAQLYSLFLRTLTVSGQEALLNAARFSRTGGEMGLNQVPSSCLVEGWFPLHSATFDNDVEEVEHQLVGANIEDADKRGWGAGASGMIIMTSLSVPFFIVLHTVNGGILRCHGGWASRVHLEQRELMLQLCGSKNPSHSEGEGPFLEKG